MRLLNTLKLKIEDFENEDVPRFAILSHRWFRAKEEPTLQDFKLGQEYMCWGITKLRACCTLARSRGHKYLWADTCCIVKTSSAELTESINSMFRWYQTAEECYAFLVDVQSQDVSTAQGYREFSRSEWFTRGWTLQELIAPANVLFYNASWQCLGTKKGLCRELSQVTSIGQDVLRGERTLAQCTIAHKMSWAAQRTTQRVEDLAYCLLGLFDVYMPLLYGEKERAFRRLQEEILKHSDDHTIFTWQSKSSAKSVLAPSPVCFSGLQDIIRIWPTNDTSKGYSLINADLSIQLQLIPWTMNIYLAPLRAGTIKKPGRDSPPSRSTHPYNRACIFLQQTEHENQFFRVSIDGQDLVVLDGSEVARMRDEVKLQPRQIIVRQLNETSYVTPSDIAFYGFHLSFNHRGMFEYGRSPGRGEVLCHHEWQLDTHPAALKLRTGTHGVAGVFRLSGFATGLLMYIGFDLDFSPLCLITFRSPRSRTISLLPHDFGALSAGVLHELLDLKWLRSELKQGVQSGGNIFALKCRKRERTHVECKSLRLSITFEWKYSHSICSDTWVVDFAESRHYDELGTIPDRSHTHKAASGFMLDPRSSTPSQRLDNFVVYSPTPLFSHTIQDVDEDRYGTRNAPSPCRNVQRSANMTNDRAYGGHPRKRQLEDPSYDHTAAKDVSGDNSFMDVKRQRLDTMSHSVQRSCASRQGEHGPDRPFLDPRFFTFPVDDMPL